MNINGTPDLGDAIWHLKNDAQYTIGQDGLSSLVWLDKNPTNITNSQIETKLAELETAYDVKQYQRDRVYPSIGDQLDMLWHSIDEDPTLKSKYFTFYEAIKSVKVKNPK